jgi:hypothetical protein
MLDKKRVHIHLSWCIGENRLGNKYSRNFRRCKGTSLIEEIRRKLMEMGKTNWKIQPCWFNTHVGMQGNELAIRIAKEAATNTDIIESYKKVPKKCSDKWTGEISVKKLQRKWDQTTKEEITKEYFPIVADRLNMKTNVTNSFISIIMGHGNVRSYLHRFNILETSTCPCVTEDQIIDHLLYECELLNKERDRLISTVLQTDFWPISKKDINKETFVKFTNGISFDKLTKCQIHHSKQTD